MVLRTNMTLSASGWPASTRTLVNSLPRREVVRHQAGFHKRDKQSGPCFAVFWRLLRKGWIAAWKLRAISSNRRYQRDLQACRRSLSRKVVEALLSARHVAEPVARCFRRLVLPCRQPYVKYEWVFRRLSMPGSANTFFASFINLKS
jgi:hypothetical protein